MSEQPQTGIYTCPMHPNVRQPGPGKCPQCGMALQPEGARFGMLRHMLSSPMPMAVMAAVVVALLAAAMMMWK